MTKFATITAFATILMLGGCQYEGKSDFSNRLKPGERIIITKEAINPEDSSPEKDDLPIISVVSQSASVTEGEDVRFKLVKNTVGDLVSVDYTVSETGDFIRTKNSWTDNNSRTIASNETATDWITIRTSENTIDESPGSITLTVLIDQSGTDYNRHETNYAATTIVNDDDIPIIWVVRRSASVAEDWDVKFKLVKGTTGDLVSVDYTVTESGDFIHSKSSWTGIKSRTIASTKTETNWFVVELDQDSMNESPGSVTLTVLTDQSGTDYNRHETNYAATTIITDDDLPIISVVRQSERVVAGNDVKFKLVKGTTGNQVSVDYTVTEKGDFIRNKGNWTGNKSITIASNKTETGWITVETYKDPTGVLEGSVTITVQRATGYRRHYATFIGTTTVYTVDPNGSSPSVAVLANDDNVFNRLIDEANRKRLPEVVRAIGSRVQEGVESRMDMAFDSNSTSMIEIDGKTSMGDLLELGGEAINGEGSSWHSIIGNSSFNIPLFPEESGTSPVAFWGQGDFHNSSRGVDKEAFSWDGDMFSGQFGLDARISPETLTGLSVFVTENSVDFRSEEENSLEGTHQVKMTSTSPYLGWSSFDGMSELNVFATYGLGEVSVEMEGYEPEVANSSLHMVSFGGGRNLHSFMNMLGSTSSKLNLQGGALYARHLLYDNASRIRDVKTQIHQLRLTVVSDHEYELADGSLLNPSVSAGTRQEGGDGDTWFGLELGTLINYENRLGMSVLSESGVLFAREQGVREWGIRGSLAFDHLRDNLGVQINMSPSFGQLRSDELDSLWDSNFSSLEMDDEGVNTGLDAEFAYGFGILDGNGIFTPFSGFELTNNYGQEYSFGNRVAVGSNTSFELVGSRSVNNSGQYKAEINGTVNW